MSVQRLKPQSLPTPMAAYCQVVRKNSIVTTAGMISTNAEGQVVGSDIETQTRQTLDNLQAALEAAGAGLQDVVKTTVFIKDMADYKGMNQVYNQVFQEHPPARSTVRADLVLPELLIEIEAIAVLG